MGMACSLVQKEAWAPAKHRDGAERNRDGHGLQSGTEGKFGASRAIERERDWQHGLQSGTGGLGASCKGSFQGRSILGLKKG